MSPSHTCVCLLLAMVAVKSCGANIFRIEAESTKDDLPKIDRSNASNKKDVLLYQNEMLSFKFCLKGKTPVGIKNVMYSNDGGADKCVLNFNTKKVGEFESTTATDFGKLWNVFKSSGSLGSAMTLDSGRNTVILFVKSADDYGIEIDHIDVDVGDDEVTEEIFTCNID
ncbi:hypothetical protein SNE40_016312 [Patella caerulea]|uniref:Uncharacterized protein n=1 Tax=Patella caerulea TaxID=87958 RepID=A0AAN8J909_PATCE